MSVAMTLDIQKIRQDFPMISAQSEKSGLVYFDNAATAQKPKAVIETLERFYREEYATVHRGVYRLSQEATIKQDETRHAVARFLNASRFEEIIFTRGATEAINLVAASYGRKHLAAGDEVIISALEHHANIVPWQQVCLERGAVLKVIPINENGELLIDEYKKLLSSKTKIVAVSQMSNALGTMNPVKEITALAHEAGAVVLIDGAQGVVHETVDLKALDCDFYCFSGHKIYGPTGVGVFYGKYDLLCDMDPYQTGGDMIDHVTFDKTTFALPPLKFEAGTPATASIIGLKPAIEYVESLGLDAIAAYEAELLSYATQRIKEIKGVRVIGEAKHKGAVLSFVCENAHAHDLGTLLDQENIAIRTGHHCAQPIMQFFKVPATARASFAFYNTKEEIDRFIDSLNKAISILNI